MRDISFTQNRELSWLHFNERVLEEATDASVPVLERLKFVSIFDSNLDEFFMVRVGSLTDLSLLEKPVVDNKSLMDQDEQLERIFLECVRLYKKKDAVYADLLKELKALGFEFEVGEEILNTDGLKKAFDAIAPKLKVDVIAYGEALPSIDNLELAVIFALGESEVEEIGVVRLSKDLPRFFFEGNTVVLLETLVQAYGKQFFPEASILGAWTARITRNADIDYDDEEHEVDGDFRGYMKDKLDQRRRLLPVRLEISDQPHPAIFKALCAHFQLKDAQVFQTKTPLSLGFLFALYDTLKKSLGADYVDVPFVPQKSRDLDEDLPVMAQLRKKDALLSYPYESMDPVIQLLKEAVNDPAVSAICITLYRVAKDSKVAEQLMAAAEKGKDVLVLVELRARFDEENNIIWSSNLERAGCKVIYGPKGYKCHSKVLLITRNIKSGVEYFTQIGTGNYNEKTAAMYTDFAYLTSKDGIGKDARRFFDDLLKENLKGTYEHLLVSPTSLPEGLRRLIDEEIGKAKSEEGGYIRLKMNGLTDRIAIDKLAEASRAGVKIDMLVRGITCIRPGIEGKTENIAISSIVGRFLEHHRVYQFGRGKSAKVYISSADFMTRNLRRRLEVACPIEDEGLKERILAFLDTMFLDDVKRRRVLPSGEYAAQRDVKGFVAQEALMAEAIACVNDKKTTQKISIIDRIKQFLQQLFK